MRRAGPPFWWKPWLAPWHALRGWWYPAAPGQGAQAMTAWTPPEAARTIACRSPACSKVTARDLKPILEGHVHGRPDRASPAPHAAIRRLGRYEHKP